MHPSEIPSKKKSKSDTCCHLLAKETEKVTSVEVAISLDLITHLGHGEECMVTSY